MEPLNPDSFYMVCWLLVCLALLTWSIHVLYVITMYFFDLFRDKTKIKDEVTWRKEYDDL
jgi:hypothetical protein